MIRATIHAPAPEPEESARIGAAIAAAYRDDDVRLDFEQRPYRPNPALEALEDRAGVTPRPERLEAWPVLPEEPESRDPEEPGE